MVPAINKPKRFLCWIFQYHLQNRTINRLYQNYLYNNKKKIKEKSVIYIILSYCMCVSNWNLFLSPIPFPMVVSHQNNSLAQSFCHYLSYHILLDLNCEEKKSGKIFSKYMKLKNQNYLTLKSFFQSDVSLLDRENWCLVLPTPDAGTIAALKYQNLMVR